MPFGSKSSKKEKEAAKKQPGGYPTQVPYPTQSPYPTQPSQQAAPSYPDQPPPYTPSSQPPSGAAQPPPGAAPYQPGQPAYYPQQPVYGAPPPGMHYPQMSGAGVYPLHPQIPPGSHVVGHGQFDAGARFNSGASVNVPPPPPGAMPTSAQIAAAHGGTVTMGQNRSGFFSGGSDGGISTHID